MWRSFKKPLSFSLYWLGTLVFLCLHFSNIFLSNPKSNRKLSDNFMMCCIKKFNFNENFEDLVIFKINIIRVFKKFSFRGCKFSLHNVKGGSIRGASFWKFCTSQLVLLAKAPSWRSISFTLKNILFRSYLDHKNYPVQFYQDHWFELPKESVFKPLTR